MAGMLPNANAYLAFGVWLLAWIYAIGGAGGVFAYAVFKAQGQNPSMGWLAWSIGIFVVATPVAIAASRYRRRILRSKTPPVARDSGK
jgi:hypothetical protein